MTEKQQYQIAETLSFQNLVDSDHLRSILESFSQATGLTVRLVSFPARELLFAAGRQNICTQFHHTCSASQAHCQESDRDLTSQLKKRKKICTRHCENGLVHGATPIIINKAHVADLFIGQVLPETPDLDHFKEQAKKYGFDEDAYLAALAQVPIVTEQEFKQAISFTNDMMAIFSGSGFKASSTGKGHETPSTQKQRLDYILQGTNVGTWEWNVQTGETFYNERWAGIIGYTLAELSPVSVHTMIKNCHPDDLPVVSELLGKCFNRESDYFECEIRMRHKNDSWVWIHNRGKVFSWTDDGQPLWMYGTHQEITARKQVEEALRKNESYLQSIFRAAPAGIGVVANRVLKQVNLRLCNMTGYSEDELIGQNARIFYLNDDDYNYVGQEKYQQIEKKGTGTVETRWKHKDGHAIDVLLSSTPMDPDDLLKGVTFTALDITERKRAEDQLRESEIRFRTLFNNAAEGILVADIQTRRFVYANPTICRMLGYSEQEIKQLSVNDIHPPDTLEQTLREFESQARGEKFLAPEIPCLRKDGSVFYADINTASVELEGREHNIGMFSDITARRNAQFERQRMQKLESLGTIAGGIAHDFNNLLMGVFGNIELARIDLPDDHKSGTYLTQAHSALEKARHLTGQLLTFAKGGDPVLETVDTRELVKETAAFNLSGSNILPRFDLQKGLWPAKADKGQISQVLANLIINAKQAMPDGGRLYITGHNLEEAPDIIAADRSWKYVRLSIRDEGTGIPKKIIDRIFDPYFTTKQSGSGLGLAIVHSIITKHGGHISASSTSDIGTTITILLPADPSGGTEAPSVQPMQTIQPDQTALHILFMDDNKAVRSLGTTMLQKFGHIVDEAIDGKEALEKYISAIEKKAPYDLVFLDLTVPGGMGGKETIEALLVVDPKTRAIVSSGYSSDPVIASYSDHGFSGCLTKPFTLASLRQEIERVMGDK